MEPRTRDWPGVLGMSVNAGKHLEQVVPGRQEGMYAQVCSVCVLTRGCYSVSETQQLAGWCYQLLTEPHRISRNSWVEKQNWSCKASLRILNCSLSRAMTETVA